MKRLWLFLVLAALAVGGVFAQQKYDGSKKNTIFFGPIMAGYERTLFNGFSAGAEVGFNYFGLGTDSYIHLMPFFADGFARWYPWKQIFFVNLGLGYQAGGITVGVTYDDEINGGFHVKPQAGWKIDIGEAGGWVFETRAGMGMTFSGNGTLLTFAVPVLFGRTF